MAGLEILGEPSCGVYSSPDEQPATTPHTANTMQAATAVRTALDSLFKVILLSKRFLD